jgi:superfamily II DNA or RNA helicase
MNRQAASELLRKTLDENNLKDWHIRISTDTANPSIGLCSYKDSCIILNAHFIDQLPEIEVVNRIIPHEVAHALTPGHQHDTIWEAKAKELGCDDTSPCAIYSLSEIALDAIRSGAELVVSFTEEKVMKPITTYEEVTVRKPKYEVRKLEDRCNATLKSGAKCHKVLKEMTSSEFISKDKRWKRITYECGHSLLKLADSQTLFENFITFEHRDNGCKHTFDKNRCSECGAFRPFPFQIEGMRRLERNDGKLGLFDEMGLGKTIQTLGWINFHAEALPVLYVVKSGIKYQWLSAITTWLGPKYFAQVLQSSKETFLPGLKSYIVSYDLLRRLDQSKFERLIDKIGIKTLVLDECQHIKNPDSSRTQMVRMLAKKIPNIIPLSGTPWKNRGSEFFVVLNMLDPRKFWSFKAFKDQWVETYWDGSYEKEGGIRNPEKFKEYIKDIAIRRERIEVMPELPTISRNKLIVEVPETVRASYDAAKQKLIDDYNDAVIGGEENTFGTQSKVMQNLMLMRQIIGMAKIPGTVEYLQDWLTESHTSVICFVHHKACGEQIFKQMSEWCIENKYSQPLKLTADLSSEDRYKIQEEFNNSSNPRVLVASTLASGEGLNLQKQCWKVVFHERQWNPANEEQAEGRVLRIGQISNSIEATYIHGDDTIDTQLDAIVERKRRQFHAAMNKGEMPIWNESGIMKELINSIVSSGKKK